MVSNKLLAVSLIAYGASAYPFVTKVPGVDSSLFGNIKRQQKPEDGPGAQKNCPFNPVHPGAAPISDEYPYNGAKNGLPGKGQGGFLVPADGDTAHYFTAPDPEKDIRGPCPGLNTLANHNFLSHDGITTFNELVDAQQNVYNVGYDLAVLLAVLGLTTTDGDLVTMKLSIGCDATDRTSFAPLITGSQPGLAGHNKFEADTSLTREDYFIGNPIGDNFHFNASRFSDMVDSTQRSTGGLFNQKGMATYRKELYEQSRRDNPHFYFGPFSLLLFGASSFLYELFPSGTRDYVADLFTIRHFFGAEQDSNGEWVFNNAEQLPPNWTNRKEPYNVQLVGQEIFAQYRMFPVQFGGATADGSYNVISGPKGLIENGDLGEAVDAQTMSCFLYMLATERVPTSLNGILDPTVRALSFALNQLQPGFDNLGCPFPLT